jgi:hypothetical protein
MISPMTSIGKLNEVELYQALNMKKIMKKNPLRKYKFPCPFFISPI